MYHINTRFIETPAQTQQERLVLQEPTHAARIFFFLEEPVDLMGGICKE